MVGLVERLAAFDIEGGGNVASQMLAAADWDSLIQQVVVQRMEGLLAAAVESDALPVSDSQLDSVRTLGRSRARADLLLERETLRTSRLLHDAGVPHRILKGPALAHTIYPDPSLRGFGDVDVLVHTDYWYSAIEAFERHGARRVLPELRPGFEGRFGRDATILAATGWEIDLHRLLTFGPYGLWADPALLFERPAVEVTIGGDTFPVLDPECAFVHACYNAALGDDPPRLTALRDVGRMLVADNAEPEDTFSLARRLRGVGVVRRAIMLVAGSLGTRLGRTPLAERFSGPIRTRDRLIMVAYRGAGRGYTSQLTGALAVRGLRSKAAYLGALARPQTAYLEARGFTSAGFARHAIRLIRSRR